MIRIEPLRFPLTIPNPLRLLQALLRREERPNEGAHRERGVPLDAALTRELEQVRRRDPEAIGAFFDRYFGAVYSLAARLLRSRPEAEDLCQEVFLRVHRGLDRLDTARDPVPWLMTITYNTCRDYWRSRAYRSSRRAVSFEENPELSSRLSDPAAGPEEQLRATRREAMVQQALRALPEESRALILLRDYRGLTHDEIAAVLGIKVAAVRKRYSRALKELGEKLKGLES